MVKKNVAVKKAVKKVPAKKSTAVKKVPKKAPAKKASVKKSPVEKTIVRSAVSKAKTKVKDISEQFVDAVVHGMQEKKANKIAVMDLRNIHSDVADFFIVCHATSRTQVDAIARSVEEEVFKKLNTWPSHSEGYENSEWILLDYFDVVVHIFMEDKRDFYRIEKLWADAEITFHNI